MNVIDQLPVHPATGLRAIGFGKFGYIFPILGAADDDEPDDLDEVRNKVPSMTHSLCVQRCEEINARMKELTEIDTITDADQGEFERLSAEFDLVNNHRKRLELKSRFVGKDKEAKELRDSSGAKFRLMPGSTSGSGSDDYDRDAIMNPDSIEDRRFKNPWDMSRMTTYGREPGSVASEYRSRALSCIEKMQGTSDKVRAAATDMIERFDSKDARLSRHAIVASQPAYLRAFSKLALNRASSLTPEEQRAIAEVEEFRAMSLTDNQGGYLVPFQLDPTLIILSAGVRNDLRQVCRQVVATGDVWHGVSSSNVSWSFDAEGDEVSDDSPSFGSPNIANHMARGFVPISIEASMDEANVGQEIARLLAGGKDDLEATKLTVGSGTGEPLGFITALVAAGGSTIVAPTTAETFALADVYKVQGALPARFRSNAAWIANNLIYNSIRQFDTSGGGGFWTDMNEDRPPRLLGRTAVEAESMDGSINAAASEANPILAFGDWENFVITDRLGMAVEFIPHLVGANRRPTGQRGWFAYYRIGSGLTNAAAFRLLSVPTTA